MNKVLEHDIELLISYKQYFESFANTSILVTGATGLLGSILIKALLKFSSENNKLITVYAACRNKEKFAKVFTDYFCSNLVPIYSDITKLDISNLTIDYIIHGASITDSKTFVEKPVETILTAFDGSRNLLKQCVNKNLKGFVYLSSLEVYGTFNSNEGIKNAKENDSGYINVLSVRSSYSEGKRMIENLCISYSREYNIPVKIARLCQTFGAGVEYNDNRVFAQFARAVIENKDIILKTKGETIRNYCYTTDAVSGILTVLYKGNVGEAYNIANSDSTISIADMAELFCNLYEDSTSKVVFDCAENAEKLGYNPVMKLQLDSSKLQTLGWKPEISFGDMCKRLVDGMR
ncbi:dTDP-glucose 4,6-dehydratase [Treponema bryantii]|uniref:dTDP-glucose 4,6-dehydratase n=1 Tax=Treponema bryantii TaxID=163 RepID=A0A1H9G8J2_9SPIR|nr:NAD-dependent epimerase/dehydratase family protein [Treponema bryantii]SEQ46437.1 dTDP-glucose 4,6-dehydratase [Treponema bryantii]